MQMVTSSEYVKGIAPGVRAVVAIVGLFAIGLLTDCTVISTDESKLGLITTLGSTQSYVTLAVKVAPESAEKPYDKLQASFNDFITSIQKNVDDAGNSWWMFSQADLTNSQLPQGVQDDLGAFYKAAAYVRKMPTGAIVDWIILSIQIVDEYHGQRKQQANAFNSKLNGFKLSNWSDARQS